MKQRILHIIPNLSKGGAERLVLTICNELQKRENVEVRLVTFSTINEYGTLVDSVQWDVIPSEYIPSIFHAPKKNIAALQLYIETFAPHVIHTHLWETEVICSCINYSSALWLTHFHDNMIQMKKQRCFASKRDFTNCYERLLVLKSYYTKTKKFICISRNTYTYAYNNIPKKLHKEIHVLSNAINTKNFENKTLLKNKNQILNLVTVGSLVDKKNQIFLVAVVAILKSWGYNTNLHILGDGPNREKIVTEIEELEMEKSIFLHGNREVEEFYWNADMYVHAATYEPFGLVFLEAMAAGLPVVCLDGKGNRDIIKERENGCMVWEPNPELFAQKIYDIWNDTQLYKSMSEYAVEFAKKYDIKEYVDSLLAIYKE